MSPTERKAGAVTPVSAGSRSAQSQKKNTGNAFTGSASHTAHIYTLKERLHT